MELCISPVMDEVPTKFCPRCQTVKPITDFYRHDCTKDGIRHTCKICCNLRSKTPEARAKRRAYNQTPERRAKQREYAKRHAAKKIPRSPPRNVATAEARKAKRRAYQQTEKYKQTHRESQARYKAKLREREKCQTTAV